MKIDAPEKWVAEWIGAFDDDAEPGSHSAPLFRKAFYVQKPLKRADVFVTGLGYFQMSVNGSPVSDHCLDPVVTRYDKRVAFLSFDLMPYLNEGENVAGIVLGNGWFNQHVSDVWDYDHAPWRAEPRLICQIELLYEDGSSERVVSDESWKWQFGPITCNSVRTGEWYDSNLEIDNWNCAGFDDSDWNRAVIVSAPGGNPVPQKMPPIRVVEQLEVAAKTRISDTIDVYDFGRNISGWSVVTVSGPAGAAVTLRHSDVLLENGRVDLSDSQRFLRSGEAQTDRYILGEKKWGTFKPVFVSHGFQYLEIEKSDPEASVLKIHAEVAHTDLKEYGSFSCSNPLFNKIYECTRNSFLTNYLSYPTDCPHREKLGWTGDGQLLAEFGLFNFDVQQAYLKWLDDMVDEQRPSGQLPGIVPTSGWGYECIISGFEKYKDAGYGPQWDGVCIVLPWKLYVSCGDASILEKYYPMMQRYYRFLESWSEDGILSIGIDDHQWIRVATHPPVIATACYHRMSRIMKNVASVLKRNNDATYYADRQQVIFRAFNQKFMKKGAGLIDNGDQCAQALALAEGLVPAGEYENVVQRLVDSMNRQDGHFIAGVIGVSALTEALPRIGRSDLLCAALNKTAFPSIGCWIEQGATTLWQRWDGAMSHNHVMFGSVCDYFYKNLAGIQPDPAAPGYKHFFIRPVIPADLEHAGAWHYSPYGKISSSWKRTGGNIRFSVEIPPGSTATAVLPGMDEQILESGTYQFESDQSARCVS